MTIARAVKALYEALNAAHELSDTELVALNEELATLNSLINRELDSRGVSP